MTLKRNSLISLSLLLLTITFSCKNTENDPATFVMKNKGESMPVWMYGNGESKYIILAMHGGPGSNVLDFRNFNTGIGFRKIEEDYLVAYWQQRASGESKGPDRNDLFTIEQYVDDADKVIDELRTRYPKKEIILFGHSWGGMLSSSYLKDSARRGKIKAWINAAGVHNGTILIQNTIIDIDKEADKRIQANENTEYWKGVKQNLIKEPEMANSLAYSVTYKIPEVLVKVDNTKFKFTKRALQSNDVLTDQILSTNNSLAISEFKLPTLLLWGEYDFAVSKTLRDEVIANTPVSAVSILFPASGHYMMFHEPVLFAKSIKDFIENL